ncbi:MAG: 1,2-phenylacetyl-CoA epoxidase subunit PaaD [Nocardioides sp.]|nr:1,2-phenylacetyl-CoA epoxidase subunit PaaD [Nocardioides sp.]
MSRASTAAVLLEPDEAWAVAAEVVDPELPVLTLADLGVLRAVDVEGPGVVRVEVTPTYLGCPAREAIADDLRAAFAARGQVARVDTVWSPPWTTDRITDRGRAALAAAGIAPPAHPDPGVLPVVSLGRTRVVEDVDCPRCGSGDTRETARCGPTACTALRVCEACAEPFEHVRTLR